MTPLCKVCGKPVPKQMTHHAFGASEYAMRQGNTEFWRSYSEKPATREDAQRLVGNRPIVGRAESYTGDYVRTATTWDGESYVWGGHFHAQACAAQFGRAMADQFPTHAMPAHRAAVAALTSKAAKRGQETIDQ